MEGRKGVGGKQAKPDELTLTASTPKIIGGSNTVRVRVRDNDSIGEDQKCRD